MLMELRFHFMAAGNILAMCSPPHSHKIYIQTTHLTATTSHANALEIVQLLDAFELSVFPPITIILSNVYLTQC